MQLHKVFGTYYEQEILWVRRFSVMGTFMIFHPISPLMASDLNMLTESWTDTNFDWTGQFFITLKSLDIHKAPRTDSKLLCLRWDHVCGSDDNPAVHQLRRATRHFRGGPEEGAGAQCWGIQPRGPARRIHAVFRYKLLTVHHFRMHSVGERLCRIYTWSPSIKVEVKRKLKTK